MYLRRDWWWDSGPHMLDTSPPTPIWCAVADAAHLSNLLPLLRRGLTHGRHAAHCCGLGLGLRGQLTPREVARRLRLTASDGGREDGNLARQKQGASKAALWPLQVSLLRPLLWPLPSKVRKEPPPGH